MQGTEGLHFLDVGVMLVGIMFALSGAVWVVTRAKRRSMKRRGVAVQGKVIKVTEVIEPARGGDVGTVKRFDEIIQFTTHTGQTITGAPACPERKHDRLHQTVAVFYDPDNPERFVAPVDKRAVKGKRA